MHTGVTRSFQVEALFFEDPLLGLAEIAPLPYLFEV